MWFTQFRWLILLVALLSLTACETYSSHPQRVVIVTPVPAPREVMVVPAGYLKCEIVPGRWIYSTWIPEHRVCYAHAKDLHKVTWVAGYWACTKHTGTGRCKHWEWHSAHFHNAMIVY